MAFQIQREIARALQAGCTLMIYKTSPRVGARGGRQLVSVGRYHKAVGSSGYAVIDKDDVVERMSAITAAKAFIERVGRTRAREAFDHRKCRRG